MPESIARRHRQREIRENDFSLTSGGICTPAKTSGVNNLVSAIFFTLHSNHKELRAASTIFILFPVRLFPVTFL
jgi:hypothetical protein